ncbi:MAG: histidine kinase, partial [Microbacteriaceae bacterium]|nr:histidine kinase [Microbacteriaceae bacterium]
AAAVLSGIGLAWWWVESRQRLAAPFDADVQILDHGQAAQLGTVYTVVFLLVLGGALLLRRSALREEERRALQARAGEVEGQAAVVAERARLARDLHDVVAHHVSLIAVRAETAPYTDPEIGEVGRRVLGDIAADARMALDELRGVLGILGRAGDAERAPQPTWSDISALVERSRAAGVDVRLQGETSAQVSVGAGYAAYRLVQEALTNARRHAPGEQVEVELAATGRLLSVRVVNGGAAAANIGGHGLVGMRERVEALGGRFRAGRENGSFVVEATLPQTATEDVA